MIKKISTLLLCFLTQAAHCFLHLPKGNKPMDLADKILSIMKFNNTGFFVQSQNRTIIYNGYAVLQQEKPEEDPPQGLQGLNDDPKSNISLYIYLVPSDEMVLFPTNHTEIRMVGFNFEEVSLNDTQGEYFGPSNATFITYDNNTAIDFTRMVRLYAPWMNKTETENNSTKNFSIQICDNDNGWGDCYFPFAPSADEVKDITNTPILNYWVSVLVTLPICSFALVYIFMSKDLRRVPGYSLIFVSLNTVAFMLSAVSSGGKMGLASSYNLAYFFSLVSFFSFIKGITRTFSKSIKKQPLGFLTGSARVVLIAYFMLKVVFFPITKNFGTYLMSLGPIILLLENRGWSKNRYMAYSVLCIMIMVQLNLVYINHYEYNSARLPVKWNDGPFWVIIWISSNIASFVTILMSEHKPVDPFWDDIDVGRKGWNLQENLVKKREEFLAKERANSERVGTVETETFSSMKDEQENIGIGIEDDL